VHRVARIRRLLRRYLPAEISGTAAALTGACAAYRFTGSPYAAALGGSVCEAAGYYAAILADEARRSRGGLRELSRSLPGVIVEFGPAEVLDTLVFRPLLMAAGVTATGDPVGGTLTGKVGADVLFYSVVLPSSWLRARLFTNRIAAARQAGEDAVAAAIPVVPSPVAAPGLVTPYLTMDLGQVGRAYRELRTALPEAAVHYAMKCNPDRRILRTLADAGASFEIASAGELSELIAVGVRPADVLFSNPVKFPEHVRAAYAAGVWRFAFDSDAELDKIAEHAPGAAAYVRLATAAAGSEVPSEGKFGVDAPTAARLLRRAVTLGLRCHGITFHVGSQMIDPGAWETAIAHSATVIRDLLGYGLRIAMLDLGGGFPARYDHDVPDLAGYGKQIRTAVETYLPYPVDLVVEPGRVLVAAAGTMTAGVIGVARRGERLWVHLDVGAFNGMMESLETQNQLRYPVSDSRNSPRRIRCTLTGPTCDSQDTMLHDVKLSADLTVGDQVFIHVAGAYTTGYASRFNGFDIPPVHCSGPVSHAVTA
jgi:ornithine decarboxylase